MDRIDTIQQDCHGIGAAEGTVDKDDKPGFHGRKSCIERQHPSC